MEDSTPFYHLQLLVTEFVAHIHHSALPLFLLKQGPEEILSKCLEFTKKSEHVVWLQFVAARQHFKFMLLEEQTKDSESLQQGCTKLSILP